MRETYKDVTINGRSWRINKFDALTGSYIVFVIITKVLPLLSEQDRTDTDKVVAKVQDLPTLDRDTFEMIQKSCLKACQEITVVNDVVVPINVMLPDGRWGVNGLFDDAVTVILLTIAVLGYNLQSFFEENALKEFKAGISNITLK